MHLYLNKYAEGIWIYKFTAKPDPKALCIEEEAEWELPEGITLAKNDKGEEGFVFNDYWWRPLNHLHIAQVEGAFVPYVEFLDYSDEGFKAFLFNKKGEPPRKAEKLQEEDFMCGHCGSDVSIAWNRKLMGNKMFCPYCGKLIELE